MFKKLASEALGLSDIGVIVPPADYGKVDADDYLFHEDGEKIFFLIKSKKDEYCFTNFGLIHVDGESAVSSKRSIKRYDFSTTRVSNVTIETAGTVDRDVELKFTLGQQVFSIDVRKNFIEQLKDIYKALIAIGRQQGYEEMARHNAGQALGTVAGAFKIAANDDETLVRQFGRVLDALNERTLIRHMTRDFGAVFQRYIQG